MRTIARKPFTSLDRIDDKGVRAEVSVYLGTARVSEIEKYESGLSASVRLKADNTPYSIKGNVVVDSPTFKTIEKYLEKDENTPFEFRIEKVRKEGVDRETPMAELSPPGDMKAARDNIYRNLVGVRPYDDDTGEPLEDWSYSSAISTRPEEDERWNDERVSALEGSLEDFTGESSRTEKKNRKEYHGVQEFGFEAPPYVTVNSDGKVNPGSTAVSAVTSTHDWVMKYCANNDMKHLGIEDTRRLSMAILSVANRLQREIYDEEIDKPFLSLNSYTRARALIYSCIENSLPITFDTNSSDDLKKWMGDVYDQCLSEWKFAISYVEKLL